MPRSCQLWGQRWPTPLKKHMTRSIRWLPPTQCVRKKKSHLKASLCLLQFCLSQLLHKKQSDHDKTSINIFAAGCMMIVSDLVPECYAWMVIQISHWRQGQRKRPSQVLSNIYVQKARTLLHPCIMPWLLAPDLHCNTHPIDIQVCNVNKLFMP